MYIYEKEHDIIYHDKDGFLRSLNEKKFKSEREIQDICEKNLRCMLDLEFVCSEFKIKGLRIDTLAFDNNSNSFVIIEYKKDENASVIDQGFAYLSVLLRNKSSVVLRYNKCCNSKQSKAGINWHHSRVVFISQSYTMYQKNIVSFKDLPIELYNISQYEGGVFQLEKINSQEEINLTRPPVKRKYDAPKRKERRDIKPKEEKILSTDNGLLGINV
jgi:hypothetical protein